MDKKRKMVFWGAPCRQDEHQVLLFYVKMLHFFSVILVFYPRQVRGWYLWRKAPWRVDEQELPWQDSRWVPSLASTFVFWMSSSRKPACPWFWLKQELRIEGEQVRYFNIQVSFVAFRSNARVKPQQTPFSDSDERTVAEMSRDRKYITTEGFKHALFTTFSEQTKNNNKEPSDDFTPHPSACCYILNTHTY